MKNKEKESAIVPIVILSLAVVFSVVVVIFSVIGRYQVCKLYFSEMSAPICMVSNLPTYQVGCGK